MISKEGDSMMTSSPSATAAVSPAGSQQGMGSKGRRYRQRPLGPAPFASFEDLSDELDSPPETARVPLPGIKEDPASQIHTPSTPHPMSGSFTEKEDLGLKEALSSSLDAPAPPRIDISRASSSSQHEDSITSSPDREGGPQTLGYKEDGTVDLRSSTEELDYIQEPGTVEESEAKRKREKMMKKQQQLKQDFGETQSEIDFKERKNSSCSVMSEAGLLCISGRTSRLSSIGSVASGGSAASGASHLSAGSHMSGRSTRSPSPHKMLLETSFCGSKPMHTQSIEAEAAPALVSYIEKQASRPSSRISSRSPSPHKMLLETSFCGTKQIVPPLATEAQKEISADQVRSKKKERDLISKVEDGEGLQKIKKLQPQAPPEPKKEDVKQAEAKVEPKVEAKAEPKLEAKVEAKAEAKLEAKVEAKAEPAKREAVAKPRKAKPVNIPRIPDKRNYSKPKKIISIRDIPADEIYIPLKGPEVDFEEIIRKASPNLKRKVDKPEKSSEDVIFIPLHSPTESEKEKERERESEATTEGTTGFKQNFDDGIYIPLHSPPKSPRIPGGKTGAGGPPKDKIFLDNTIRKLTEKTRPKVKSETNRKPKYEVCEDGSIFIPLHSPDEDGRQGRTFEEEIRRVDEELQKAREMAEKRLREEESQSKPGMLDLSDYGNRQSLPAGRPELTPGGSRTPSPGSTLSRKSSFASIFRWGDASGSPESSGASLVRKKSGTFSNIIKEAGDGLRDRSRSRNKNRERPSQTSVVRSPSIKKNVFTNLFGKKKEDDKGNYGKADDKSSARLDQQMSYGGEGGGGGGGSDKSKFSASEGDYIIIPLRDPSDPSPGLEDEAQEEPNEKLPSPVVVLERFDAQKLTPQSKEEERVVPVVEKADSETESVRQEMFFATGEEKGVESSERETEEVEKRTGEIPEDRAQEKAAVEEEEKELTGREEKTKSEEEVEKEENESVKMDPKKKENDLQNDSSLDMEEGPVKEEMMAVSTGGVRKLKLPPEPGDLVDDHERKGLVLQESFEDELPYVPTTLPLERSVGVPIIPVKQRVAEVKTCPIDRPRSTTPINPSAIEEYVSVREHVRVAAEEKMRISLPREDSLSGKAKSPRRFSAKGKSWFEFAEEVSQSPKEPRKGSSTTTPSPPPLPPRSSPPVALSTSAPQATSSWINFEEIPEKRKQPKRITTVPPLRSSDGPEKPSASHGGNVVYSYVSPEDCQCECHDHNSHPSSSHSKESKSNRGTKQQSKLSGLDPNSECKMTNKLIETQGDIDKSVKNECKDCESGRHAEPEDDVEEKKPLLDYNSDGENDDSSSRREPAGEWELTVPGRRGGELDGQSFLSDSSYECTSQDAGNGFDDGGDRAEMKPFEIDFDVKSNRSSLVSQDEQATPEELSSSLPL